MTLKYNIYFNGSEAYKRGINRIIADNKENYTQILPIFVDSKEELASSASGEMDKAIQKASKGIKQHSITAKPKNTKSRRGALKKEQDFYNQSEFNRWVDDAYFLMGRAYFIKRDYTQAKQNFEYVIRQFPNEDIKYDAYLYLARIYSEQAFFKDAKEMLDLIEAQKEFPRKKLGMFNLIYADYYLKQKQYENAIPKLEKGIELTKKRKEKSRYLFILAQIYEKQNNLKKATELYELAAKRNSSYEMEFSAKMNIARCYAIQGKDTRNVRKKLLKMLKDEKNIEYKDQIYYAIAEIDYNAGKIDNAVENYKKSSEVSVENDFQKAISNLKAGEIYFSRLDYRNAQIHYDTAIMFLPSNYEDYSKIRTHSVNLNELISNIDVVELQDSVQILAKMSEGERNKIIDKIIADVIEQERIDREAENLARMNSIMFDQHRSGTNSSVGSNDGKWYFYSPSQVSFGKNEFSKKWGNRKSEDHWRRKDKGIVDMFAMDNDEEQDSTTNAAPRVTNNKTRDYYLQDIPLTDSALSASHEKIITALYNIGGIYKDKFSDYKKSIDAYEDLNKRYPKNDYLLYSYYNLYLLNKLINDQARMDYYQDLIATNFPHTNYAKILKNPNYIKEQEEKRQNDEQFYIETYDKYMEGRCDIVKNNVRKFLRDNEADPNNSLIPKFEFFNTLCVGKFSDTTEFKSSLVNFMQKYANDELSLVAQNILEYFGTEDIQALIAELKSRPDVVKPDLTYDLESTTEEDLTETVDYIYDENAEHYYIIYVKIENVDVKRLCFEVRNFNIFNFSMRTFNVVNTIFNDDYELVSIRSFRNLRQSLNYSKMIANNEDVFSKLKEKDYKTFIISIENFKKLQETSNIESYLRFYNKNYLK
jgi:tetratricopeptide (TPR) repeat protein